MTCFTSYNPCSSYTNPHSYAYDRAPRCKRVRVVETSPYLRECYGPQITYFSSTPRTHVYRRIEPSEEVALGIILAYAILSSLVGYLTFYRMNYSSTNRFSL